MCLARRRRAQIAPAHDPGYPFAKSTARRYRHTYAAYLELEKASPLKLEYSDGEVFATAGGTPEHGALAMQLVRLVSPSLEKGCVVYSSDVKVRVEATDLATYPDVSIVCGPLVRAGDDANAVTNPRFIVEVTSASTEDYDRGDEISQYKQLASLEAILLVSHRRREVTVVSRESTERSPWLERSYRAGERVELAGGVAFDVSELYSVTSLV